MNEKRLEVDTTLHVVKPEELNRLRKEVANLEYKLRAEEQSSLAKYKKLESSILSNSEVSNDNKETDSFLRKIDEVDFYLLEVEKEASAQVTLLSSVAQMTTDIEKVATDYIEGRRKRRLALGEGNENCVDVQVRQSVRFDLNYLTTI